MPHQPLSRYSNIPLYNIKAVEQATGVAASTLRVWERRYGVPTPNRNETGYRLYSERDIATVAWLKHQLDDGMSISQAVARLEALREGGEEPAIVLGAGVLDRDQNTTRSLPVLQDALIAALLDFNTIHADHTLTEAFALYPVETVALSLIQPTLVEIGEGWHRGDMSIAQEHFATAYLRQKLENLFNQTLDQSRGPLVIGACVRGEQHEIGLLIVSLFLRRRGYHIVYLGANVPAEELIQATDRLHPALLCLSASTNETAIVLHETVQRLSARPEPRPIIGFGGRIFRADPRLRETTPGVYLGDDAHATVETVEQLLSAKP